ncbi:carbohydrate kinase family protein [Massilia sp. GCM10020059]|uniref:Carbohydrate kinase family protein n=1 Tax=Massilia agrisoli TaxID=2892444 RepID=A0ABS8IM47_9BURK|nr:carbohydrate kinase family protein [Massilia agrisoli]MCC6069351.1 carbohydrate kinase family protein [Massilia agrisoli]
MTSLVVAGLAYLEVYVPPHDAAPPGQERFVDGIALGLGGALNTASVAAGLGLPVTLCAPAGNGIADLALAAQAARLGVTLAPLPARDDPAISLVFADAHDRSFVSSADFAALEQAGQLPAAGWIFVPGLEEAARLAAPLARARRDGAKVAVSASWNEDRLAQLAALRGAPWDLLVLNEKEAMAACGDIAAAPQLLAGAAGAVIVTLGPRGASGTLDGSSVSVPAVPAAVVDTTGAGDAFCGGLLAGLVRGLAPAAALQLAARAAAIILEQRGGMLAAPDRMAALAREIA